MSASINNTAPFEPGRKKSLVGDKDLLLGEYFAWRLANGNQITLRLMRLDPAGAGAPFLAAAAAPEKRGFKLVNPGAAFDGLVTFGDTLGDKCAGIALEDQDELEAGDFFLLQVDGVFKGVKGDGTDVAAAGNFVQLDDDAGLGKLQQAAAAAAYPTTRGVAFAVALGTTAGTDVDVDCQIIDGPLTGN